MSLRAKYQMTTLYPTYIYVHDYPCETRASNTSTDVRFVTAIAAHSTRGLLSVFVSNSEKGYCPRNLQLQRL